MSSPQEYDYDIVQDFLLGPQLTFAASAGVFARGVCCLVLWTLLKLKIKKMLDIIPHSYCWENLGISILHLKVWMTYLLHIDDAGLPPDCLFLKLPDA